VLITIKSYRRELVLLMIKGHFSYKPELNDLALYPPKICYSREKQCPLRQTGCI